MRRSQSSSLRETVAVLIILGLIVLVGTIIFYNPLVKAPQLEDEIGGRVYDPDEDHPSRVVIVAVTDIKGLLGIYTFAVVDVDLYVERPDNMIYLGTSEGSTVLNWQTPEGGGESWRYDVVIEDVETESAGVIDLHVDSIRNVWVVDDIDSITVE